MCHFHLTRIVANYKITDFYSALTKGNDSEKMIFNPMEIDSNKYKTVLESLNINLINNRAFQKSLVKNNSKKNIENKFIKISYNLFQYL